MSMFGTNLAKAKDLARKKGSRAAVELVIADYRSWGTPDDGERDDFLDTFAAWLNDELKKDETGLKAMRDVRSNAILHIRKYFDSQAGGPAFRDVEPNAFAVELAVRVRRPRMTDQGATGLCGPAALMYTFAKSEPLAYATLALDLFFKGKGMYRNMPIAPTETIKNGYRQRIEYMNSVVDYVLLVSLRACTFQLVGPLRGGDETTLPGQLGRWLEQAGYREIETDTFFNFGWLKMALVNTVAGHLGQPVHHRRDERELANPEVLRNLSRAASALQSGKFVILFTDGELSHFLNGTVSALTPRTSPTGLGEHHYVAVRRLVVTQNDVTVRAITWQCAFDHTFPLGIFLPRYNGYLAARP